MQRTLTWTGDQCWQAVVARDAQADSVFLYSVSSTGIYCRPSCSARRARREHVTFHPSCLAAELAGFRPCKRCRPLDKSLEARQAAAVARICRSLDSAMSFPTLDRLAADAGMSRFHFTRVFKTVTGVTPLAYFQAARARRVPENLQEGSTITDAIYGAGFNSSGRFYSKSNQALGMTPRERRAGGNGTRVRFAIAHTTLGALLVAATQRGICSISMGADAEKLLDELQQTFPQAELIGNDAEFEGWVAQVVNFVETPRASLHLPLDLQGTTFQMRVWQALQRIPAGQTATYAQIAHQIDSPQSVRAVARACATNPVALAVPCHRVIRQDGHPSGYRWGLERKAALLERERLQ